jgi:extracellular elastinolytic metalloproteinase
MIKNYLSSVLLFVIAICSINVYGQSNIESSEFGDVIINYLNDRKSDFEFEDEDIARLVVNNQFYSETTDLNNVYVNQTFQGIRIYNAISSIAIRDNEVFYYANRFLKDISNKVNTTNPSQSPESALNSIASHFQLGSVQNLEQIEMNGFKYIFSNGNISSRNITAELVFVNSENQLKLAWDIMVYANDDEHWYSTRVDANTNEIIEYNNLILTCTFDKNHSHNDDTNDIDFYNSVSTPSTMLVDGSSYNVFALPTESPNHGPRQIVTNPASTLASPFGWHDDDGLPGAEYTVTRGNNVLAQEDRDGIRFTPGFTPDGTSNLNFDFPLDMNQPPEGYEEVSITNLFYMNNMMHDIWYHHGFTEDTGNFQANNYGNGGAENDIVVADAQDGSGLNNATFGTPVDGQSPGMTMFLWSPPGPLDAPLTINNGTVAGDYDGTEAGFGGPLTTTPITTSLILVTDATPDVNDVCQALTNSAQINGNIAVIRRGTCEFGAKVFAVQTAGAVAAIVVNNEPNGTITMGAGDLGNLVNIPSIMVSQADGEAIISALSNGESLSATLVNNGPYLIDGDFDNGIIAHEYGHGISTRLTGGASSVGCLFNEEQMGEGWSDWFGLMVTMKDTDTSQDARGIGTFAISQPTTGGGIRPRRYSPNFAVNEFTYDITNNPGISVPHGVGFVWATMLWDLTWAYIDKYGFDADLYTGDGGNNKLMKLVLEGLKLQPCNPGFIDGRDALLAADMAITGGVDQCIIWDVFAKRGLGFNASQGLSTSRADQIEDFTLPPDNDPSLANCSSLSVDDFTDESLSVYPNPTQNQLTIAANKNYGKVVISLIDINGRVVLELQKELFNNVTIDTNQLHKGIYILNIKGETFNYNEKIIKN